FKKQIFSHIAVNIVIHYRTENFDDIITQIKHILFSFMKYTKIGKIAFGNDNRSDQRSKYTVAVVKPCIDDIFIKTNEIITKQFTEIHFCGKTFTVCLIVKRN